MKKRVLVAPFVVLPLAARLFVGPIGDSFAADLARVAPATPSATEHGGEGAADDEPAAPAPRHGERGRAARHDAPMAGSQRTGGHRELDDRSEIVATAGDAGAARSAGGVEAGAPRATIVVPSAVVASAIADKKIGARDAVDENGEPLGARIHGVGRYKTGLQTGDVIVSVGGTPTPTTAALVEVAMRILGAGASKLTGRIKRGDAFFDVVLEVPPRTK